MVLVPSDGENIEINGGQGFVDVAIDDDFVDNTKRLDKIDTLLGGVKDIRMGFCLQDDRAILNSHDQVIAQLFCIFKETQVSKVEIVKYSDSNHFFHGTRQLWGFDGEEFFMDAKEGQIDRIVEAAGSDGGKIKAIALAKDGKFRATKDAMGMTMKEGEKRIADGIGKAVLLDRLDTGTNHGIFGWGGRGAMDTMGGKDVLVDMGFNGALRSKEKDLGNGGRDESGDTGIDNVDDFGSEGRNGIEYGREKQMGCVAPEDDVGATNVQQVAEGVRHFGN